jgi:hypothetical protein
MTKCEKCGIEYGIGDWPFCKGGHGKYKGSVIADEIPGGVEIRHGLCNEDGSPRRYYSHSEIAKEAKRRGLVNRVEHVPLRGSDKSPHTTKWT